MALDSAERLARVRHLLAGLPGPYGNEHLWTLIGFASGENPFTNVFAFLNACDVIDPASSFGGAPQAPQDAEELAARMAEVNQDAAFAVLVGMTSRTLAYRVRGRYPVHNAEAVYEKLIMLLGHGTCTTGNPAGRAEQALRNLPSTKDSSAGPRSSRKPKDTSIAGRLCRISPLMGDWLWRGSRRPFPARLPRRPHRDSRRLRGRTPAHRPVRAPALRRAPPATPHIGNDAGKGGDVTLNPSDRVRLRLDWTDRLATCAVEAGSQEQDIRVFFRKLREAARN